MLTVLQFFTAHLQIGYSVAEYAISNLYFCAQV